MYVSVTGLKPRGLMGWIRFLALTLPASKNAQNAEGVLLCSFTSHHHFQHTLTVWQSKEHMLGYRSSPSHVRAMKNFSKIGTGKVYSYETDAMLDWDDALAAWDKYAREH